MSKENGKTEIIFEKQQFLPLGGYTVWQMRVESITLPGGEFAALPPLGFWAHHARATVLVGFVRH